MTRIWLRWARVSTKRSAKSATMMAVPFLRTTPVSSPVSGKPIWNGNSNCSSQTHAQPPKRWRAASTHSMRATGAPWSNSMPVANRST